MVEMPAWVTSPDPAVVERITLLNQLGIPDDPNLSIGQLRDRTAFGADVDNAMRVGEFTSKELLNMSKGTVLAPYPSGADDTSLLNKFFADTGGKQIYFPPAQSYQISDKLSVPANININGQGSTIKQNANLKQIFDVGANTDIFIWNMKFVGKTTDYADTTASYVSSVVRATAGAKRISILGCDIRGFAGAAIWATGASDIRISGNTIVGVGNGGGAGTFVFTGGVSKDNCGVIFDGACSKIWVEVNSISYTAQGVLTGTTTDLSIHRNTIFNIGGQHGIYCNNTVILKITQNTITNTAAQGIKVQLSTFGNGDCTKVLIEGNILDTINGSMVHCTISPTAGADRFKDITISHNIGKGLLDGILLQNADGFIIDNNQVNTCSGAGLRIDDCINGAIEFNIIRNTNDQGIRVNGSVTTSPVAGDNIRIAFNRIMDPAISKNAATNFGFSTSGCGNLKVEFNWITDSTGLNMRYGIYVAGGTQTTMDFVNNSASGATDYGFRGIAGQAARSFRNNSFAGTLGAILNPPTGYTAIAAPTAPSAAYVQAEATSMKTAVDAIRTVLQNAGLIP